MALSTRSWNHQFLTRARFNAKMASTKKHSKIELTIMVPSKAAIGLNMQDIKSKLDTLGRSKKNPLALNTKVDTTFQITTS
jgi:hypothetical protein